MKIDLKSQYHKNLPIKQMPQIDVNIFELKYECIDLSDRLSGENWVVDEVSINPYINLHYEIKDTDGIYYVLYSKIELIVGEGFDFSCYGMKGGFDIICNNVRFKCGLEAALDYKLKKYLLFFEVNENTIRQRVIDFIGENNKSIQEELENVRDFFYTLEEALTSFNNLHSHNFIQIGPPE